MVGGIDARALKARLSRADEIALIDVREHGQFGEGHLFFAASLPYSRFEIGLPGLVPNPAVEVVLCDGGDGVAARAARRAAALGYRNVRMLEGGVEAWHAAGYTLFAGVNVPSKTFGELVEQQRGTPHLTAEAVKAMHESGENCIILDGRPIPEYRRMSIPGGICCPNGELALRVNDLVPDPRTKIIVNCAGRTRSIVGAQMLIDFGVPNPVYALENGTQGWSLAGLTLERNAERRYRSEVGSDVAELAGRARALAATHGAGMVAVEEANGWCSDRSRTTYLLDVRSPEEFAGRAIAGFVHAPGGQLLQATDHWVGVRGARLILLDDEGVRAPVVAAFLRQLGHEAYVLEGGSAAAATCSWLRPAPAPPRPLAMMAAAEVRQGTRIVDLRSGTSFRRGHIVGASWSVRPRLAALRLPSGAPIVLAADDPAVAALAGGDLAELGHADVRTIAGGPADWAAAGLPLQASPDDPADADMIDFLFFTAGRHEGDGDAARRYLAWEVGLIGQLDAQERGTFRIPRR